MFRIRAVKCSAFSLDSSGEKAFSTAGISTAIIKFLLHLITYAIPQTTSDSDAQEIEQVCEALKESDHLPEQMLADTDMVEPVKTYSYFLLFFLDRNSSQVSKSMV